MLQEGICLEVKFVEYWSKLYWEELLTSDGAKWRPIVGRLGPERSGMGTGHIIPLGFSTVDSFSRLLVRRRHGVVTGLRSWWSASRLVAVVFPSHVKSVMLNLMSPLRFDFLVSRRLFTIIYNSRCTGGEMTTGNVATWQASEMCCSYSARCGRSPLRCTTSRSSPTTECLSAVAPARWCCAVQQR
jgi:hypothetical protein